MTAADEEYLKRFIKAAKDEAIAKEKETILANKDPRREPIAGLDPEDDDDGELQAITKFNTAQNGRAKLP